MRINPYFEINGNTYEIKRTRHLMVVYEQLGENNQMSDEDKASAVKLQVLIDKVQKFANKLQELEKEYFTQQSITLKSLEKLTNPVSYVQLLNEIRIKHHKNNNSTTA